MSYSTAARVLPGSVYHRNAQPENTPNPRS
jgi:hypothetical protein